MVVITMLFTLFLKIAYVWGLLYILTFAPRETVLGERQSVCQTASCELLDGLGRADRMAEIRHHLSQQPMGNGFRINQHAITIENYQAHRNTDLWNCDSIIC